jgi:hypothetical protein
MVEYVLFGPPLNSSNHFAFHMGALTERTLGSPRENEVRALYPVTESINDQNPSKKESQSERNSALSTGPGVIIVEIVGVPLKLNTRYILKSESQKRTTKP